MLLTPLLLVLSQNPIITPELVQQAAREADVIVTGTLTRIDAAKLPGPSDGTPWKRATVVVNSVLKGSAKKGKTVSFLIIVTDDAAYDYAPKLKTGQKAVWLLTRGNGAVKELTALDDTAVRPLETEAQVAALLKTEPCPAQPASGTCVELGARCQYENVRCDCVQACGGGAPPPPDALPQQYWQCSPNACATAVDGAKCAPNGTTCPGCWGVAVFTCAAGKWKENHVSPPP